MLIWDTYVMSRKPNQYYQNWSTRSSFSPALNDTVIVSKLGWNHLVNKPRTKKEEADRIKLLPKAREIIEDSTTIQQVRVEENGTEFILLESVLSYHDGKLDRIRVVVLRDYKKRKYVFLSVMRRKS